jgi:hypothetical protein
MSDNTDQTTPLKTLEDWLAVQAEIEAKMVEVNG